jgi:hypothetical protein
MRVTFLSPHARDSGSYEGSIVRSSGLDNAKSFSANRRNGSNRPECTPR